MSEWQPIETVPKEKVVLGWCAPKGPYRMGVAFDASGRGKVNALIDRMSGRYLIVTHWMPLPERPK